MNKFALVSILSVAVVGIGVAQTKKLPKPAKPQTVINCAVMPNDPVKIAEATKTKMYADYKGRRYYFCCAGCPGAFKKDPAKYAKNASLPTPKPAKK